MENFPGMDGEKEPHEHNKHSYNRQKPPGYHFPGLTLPFQPAYCTERSNPVPSSIILFPRAMCCESMEPREGGRQHPGQAASQDMGTEHPGMRAGSIPGCGGGQAASQDMGREHPGMWAGSIPGCGGGQGASRDVGTEHPAGLAGSDAEL